MAKRRSSCLRPIPGAIAVLALVTLTRAGHTADDASPAIVAPAAVHLSLSRPAVAAKSTALREFGARRDTTGLVEALSAIEVDAALDPVARDHLLDTGLKELVNLEPIDAARTLVERIGTRKPRVFVALEEGPDAPHVPLIDPGATARYVARQWDITRFRKQALTALAARDTTVLAWLEGAPAQARTPAAIGLREAFESTDVVTLAAWRESLRSALGSTAAAAEPALVVAYRLNDADLYAAILASAPDLVAMTAITSIAESPALRDPVSLLDIALGRPPLASRASFALGHLAGGGDLTARARLFALLEDPARGGSAAAALATLDEPGLIRDLAARLDPGYPRLVRQRAVLALGMGSSPLARQVLERFCVDAPANDPLRPLASAWLGP
jgi:hypothetical protein